MTLDEPSELLQKGLVALSHGHTFLAMTCLEQVSEVERTPQVTSSLAYCQAVNGKDFSKALATALEALEQAPDDPECCLNLGRILLLSGRREEAVAIFRQGLVKGHHPELLSQLGQLGIRKPPIFPTLPRDHSLNKYGGKLLSFLGFR